MIIYGKQVVFYMLEKYPQLIDEIYLAKDIDKKIFHKFSKLDKPIIKPDFKKAQALAKGGNHQGFLLRIKPYEFAPFNNIKKYKFIVVLDQLTDVGNIGAIVRTSYGLGADAIIISGLKQINMAHIIRTSSAAALDIPISLIHNTADILNELKQLDFELIGASLDGIDLHDYNIPANNIALFLGNESTGLSKKVVSKLDTKVKISMSNNFDSLNVSVACGILIHSIKGGKK